MLTKITGELEAARGCGAAREQGDLYMEVNRGPGGRPVEEFLMCPPIEIILDDYGIGKLGVHPFPQEIEGKTIYHIADWIGEKHYPNVLDFIQEGGFINFSRKVQANFPFEILTKESRYLPIHHRGWIKNYQEYFRVEILNPPASFGWDCPLKLSHHHAISGITRQVPMPCARVWAQDIESGEAAIEQGQGFGIEDEAILNRFVERQLPCGGSYFGLSRPEGVIPDYQPAIIASLPIGRFVGVKSESGEHKAKMEKASKSPFIVEEVDG